MRRLSGLAGELAVSNGVVRPEQGTGQPVKTWIAFHPSPADCDKGGQNAKFELNGIIVRRISGHTAAPCDETSTSARLRERSQFARSMRKVAGEVASATDSEPNFDLAETPRPSRRERGEGGTRMAPA